MRNRVEKSLNHTWGFKWNDHTWKSPEEVTGLLASLAEKNTNYLLDIGPMPDGSFPPESLRILSFGEWMRHYKSAIYGCGANPFPHAFGQGYLTVEQREGERTRLHLMIRDFRSEVRLYGLRNQIVRCYDHSALGETIPCESNSRELTIRLPESFWQKHLPVAPLELDCFGNLGFSTKLLPQEGVLHLSAAHGRLRHGENDFGGQKQLRGLGAAGERHNASGHGYLDRAGNLAEWNNPADRIEWEACFLEPGDYQIEVVTVSGIHGAEWKTGQKVELTIADTVLTAALDGTPFPPEAGGAARKPES